MKNSIWLVSISEERREEVQILLDRPGNNQDNAQRAITIAKQHIAEVPWGQAYFLSNGYTRDVTKLNRPFQNPVNA